MSRGVTQNRGGKHVGVDDSRASDADYLERIKELDLELFGDLLDDAQAPAGSAPVRQVPTLGQAARQNARGEVEPSADHATGYVSPATQRNPQSKAPLSAHHKSKSSMSKPSKLASSETVNGVAPVNGSAAHQGSFTSNHPSARAQASVSYFYIIQLIPEALPNRVKLGHSNNMNKTITDIRVAAPTAVIVKQWRCKAAWTQTALDSITSVDCQHVLNDIFEGNVKDLVEVANDFFKLMPKSDKDIPLSDHSPLKAQYKSEVPSFKHAEYAKSYQ